MGFRLLRSARSAWTRHIGLVALCAGVVATLPLMLGPSPAAAAGTPNFREPWTCGVTYDITSYLGVGHEGDKAIDIADLSNRTHIGKPVLASAPGTARTYWSPSIGNVVEVDHGGDWSTVYAHLASVTINNPIATGEKIGTIGNTGSATTGAHLHYEQRYKGIRQSIRLRGLAVPWVDTGSAAAAPDWTSQNCPTTAHQVSRRIPRYGQIYYGIQGGSVVVGYDTETCYYNYEWDFAGCVLGTSTEASASNMRGTSDLLEVTGDGRVFVTRDSSGVPEQWDAPAGVPFQPTSADYTGDTLADLVRWNSATSELQVSASNGYSFGPWTRLVAGVTTQPTWWGPGDFTGDGKVDLAYTTVAGNAVYVAAATTQGGAPLSAPQLWTSDREDPLLATGSFVGATRTDLASRSRLPSGNVKLVDGAASTGSLVPNVQAATVVRMFSGDFGLRSTLSDLAMVRTDGKLAIGISNSTPNLTVDAVSPSPDPAAPTFTVLAGEMTGDKYSDIVFEQNGQRKMFSPSTTGINGGWTLTAMRAPLGTLTAIGDFDGQTPQSPQIDTAVGGTGSLSISWLMPDEAVATTDTPVKPGGFHAVVERIDGSDAPQTYELAYNSRSLLVDGLALERAYRVRIWTKSGVGVSAPTTLEITTKNYPAPPTPSIVGTTLAPTVVDLEVGFDDTWENSDPLDHFELTMSAAGLATKQATAPAGATHLSVGGLAPDSDYVAELRAVGAHGTVSAVPASQVVHTPPLTPQSITFPTPGAMSVGDEDVVLTAFASSELPVGYSSQTPTVCTVLNGAVHAVAGGTCVIAADQPGDIVQYAAAPRATVSFSVSAVRITTSSLPTGLAGKAYAATLAAVGGKTTYAWSLASGSLPAGLTLSAAGKITGTPVGATTSTFTVRVQDSTTPTKWVTTKPLTLAVGPMTITTSALSNGLAGVAYPQTTLKADGGKATLVWSVVSGSLPAGLKLTAGGVLSGTPTAPGTSTFTVQVADGSVPKNVATRQLTITVAPMTIATSTLPRGLIGKAYTQTTLKASGGKATLVWSVVSGSLPAGLKLTAGGVVSGTPTAPGTSTFTVQVADGSVPKNVATRQLTLVVDPMTVLTSALPNGKKGSLYSTTLKASGGKGTLAWSLVSGSLPPGLKLTAGGGISGNPTTPGTWLFTVQVADSSIPKYYATKTLSLTVT